MENTRERRVLVVGPRRDLATTLERTLREAARVDRLAPGGPSRARAAAGAGYAALVLDARHGADPEALEALARVAALEPTPPLLVLVAEGGVSALASRLRVKPVLAADVGAVVAQHLRRARGPARPPGDTSEDRRIEAAIRAVGLRFDLTAAESSVAVHAVRGLTNKEIARALDTSTTTARTHLASICRKVGVASRGELAYRLFRETHVAETERLAEVQRPLRPVVLIVSANVFLRCFMLQALDASRKLDVAVPLPAVGLKLVELGIRFGAVVIDDDVFDQGAEVVRAALARGPAPALVLLSGQPRGREHAKELGAMVLPTPLRPKEVLLVLERAVEKALAPVPSS